MTFSMLFSRVLLNHFPGCFTSYIALFPRKQSGRVTLAVKNSRMRQQMDYFSFKFVIAVLAESWLRPRALYSGLKTGHLEHCGTDHCDHLQSRAHKMKSQFTLSRSPFHLACLLLWPQVSWLVSSNRPGSGITGAARLGGLIFNHPRPVSCLVSLPRLDHDAIVEFRWCWLIVLSNSENTAGLMRCVSMTVTAVYKHTHATLSLSCHHCRSLCASYGAARRKFSLSHFSRMTTKQQSAQSRPSIHPVHHSARLQEAQVRTCQPHTHKHKHFDVCIFFYRRFSQCDHCVKSVCVISYERARHVSCCSILSRHRGRPPGATAGA